ncbi:MAG: hypothetical protein KAV25_00720, partial [Methanophagales archaeon]|nr:hypothetical protein [Methanophagales archaeon]
ETAEIDAVLTFTRLTQERIIFDNRTQMNADNQDFKYKELTEEIIRIFYQVYNKLSWEMVFCVNQRKSAS